jgi:hypothetical protein
MSLKKVSKEEKNLLSYFLKLMREPFKKTFVEKSITISIKFVTHNS